MTTPLDELSRHCADLLRPLGPVRTRRMFGGVGLYVADVFIALIAAERLYLKVDALTRPRFEAAGCEPFTYGAAGKTVTLGYFSAPDDAMESPALMQGWARMALDAALRAHAAKPASAPLKARAAAPATVASGRKPAASKAGGRARRVSGKKAGRAERLNHHPGAGPETEPAARPQHVVGRVALARQPDAALHHRELARPRAEHQGAARHHTLIIMAVALMPAGPLVQIHHHSPRFYPAMIGHFSSMLQ